MLSLAVASTPWSQTATPSLNRILEERTGFLISCSKLRSPRDSDIDRSVMLSQLLQLQARNLSQPKEVPKVSQPTGLLQSS